MFMNRPIQPEDRVYNLNRLFLFRLIVMAFELLAILIAAYIIKVSLPLVSMLCVLAVYGLFHLCTARYLHRGPNVSAREFFLNLAVDVIALALLFYFAGGSGNPFVSLFLLPLVIVASTLPRPFVLGMAAVTLACYSILMIVHVPLAGSSMHGIADTSGFPLHELGMWFSFVVGISVIVFYVTPLAEELRLRDLRLAEIRERQLRDEHVIALGTMAAGAAHELGTPLATMAILSTEMERQYAGQGALPAQLAIIRAQVDRCKTTLSQLSASAGQHRAEGGRRAPLDEWLRKLLESWHAQRTTTALQIDIQGEGDVPQIVVDDTLTQAVANVLNNAADASPERIKVEIEWSGSLLALSVRDFGSGINPEAEHQVGRAFFTTKQNGQGLGFFLARAVVGRLGGELQICNHAEGGALVSILLPLEKLLA